MELSFHDANFSHTAVDARPWLLRYTYSYIYIYIYIHQCVLFARTCCRFCCCCKIRTRTKREKTIRLALFGLLTHISHNIYFSVPVAAVVVVAAAAVYLHNEHDARADCISIILYKNAIFVDTNSYRFL